MRIGLIADIHGNLQALETILAALAREDVADLICLGDVASLGPQPAEVLARLRALACPIVLGNTDAWLLAPPAADGAGVEDRPMYALNAWCAAQLSAQDRAAVTAFPPILARPIGEAGTLLCFHGSPRSFNDVIVATTPDAMLDAMLGKDLPALMAGAHTHIQMLRRYRDRRLINPGSVGLPGIGATTPYNRDVRWAEYAAVEVDDAGLSVTFRRIPLDVEAMIARARACGMPEIAWWAATWRRA